MSLRPNVNVCTCSRVQTFFIFNFVNFLPYTKLANVINKWTTCLQILTLEGRFCTVVEEFWLSRNESIKSKWKLLMTDFILNLYSWICYCVFQMLGPTMISEEWSCSFQVFLRSGLAVNGYLGSPYPKKHLQGTLTSEMIDIWVQSIYCEVSKCASIKCKCMLLKCCIWLSYNTKGVHTHEIVWWCHLLKCKK